jgi:hypothetical protein
MVKSKADIVCLNLNIRMIWKKKIWY